MAHGSGTDGGEAAVHKSQTARTLDALRDAIVRALYAPGEKLKIDDLTRALDTSPGAVREALSRLTAEDLVVAMPQRGFIVKPVSRRDLADLTDVRVTIECLCLADTITHADIEWEGRLLSLTHQLRALDGAISEPGSERAQRWHRLHEEFHRELAGGCPNLWWLRLRNQLYLQSERYRRLSGPLETGRDIAAEHDAIAAAAIARDAPTAAARMEEHLRRTTTIITASNLPVWDDTA